jgi:hypothetical protein
MAKLSKEDIESINNANADLARCDLIGKIRIVAITIHDDGDVELHARLGRKQFKRRFSTTFVDTVRGHRKDYGHFGTLSRLVEAAEVFFAGEGPFAIPGHRDRMRARIVNEREAKP